MTSVRTAARRLAGAAVAVAALVTATAVAPAAPAPDVPAQDAPAQDAPAEDDEPAPPRSLGTPLSDVLLIGGHVGTRDGQRVIWSVSTGSPAYLNAVDPVDGTSVAAYPLDGASGSYAVEQAPDGTVYVGTYGGGRLYRLDPGADAVVDLGVPVAGETFVWDIIIDPEGVVYGGTYPGGKVFSYDPASGEFRDYGQMIAGQTYVKSIAWGDGKVYAGAYADARITELDPVTGEKTELPSPPDFDISGQTVNDLNVRDGRLYARIGSAFPSPLFVYDLAAGTWTDRIEGAAGLDVSPPGADGRVWFFRQFEAGSSELIAYDPVTTEQERTGLVIYGRVVNTRGIGWAELGLPDYPGPSIVGLLWRGEEFRYNPETGAHEVFPSGIRREPIDILSLEAGAGSTAYVGGFLNGGVAPVDIVTGESTFNRFSQTESLSLIDGELWIGAYPDARIYKADPEAGWNSPEYAPNPEIPENPVKMLDLKDEHQNRPYGLVGAAGKVFTGTVPAGDRLGGVLAEIDRSTGESVVHRQVVQDQSIVSLAAHDDVVYGSTWIFGGLATTPPTQSTGKVFAWDAATATKLWEVEPVPGATGIPAVAVDRDGLVWGITDGRIFALDPADGSVVHDLQVTDAEGRWTTGELTLDPTSGDLYALLQGDQVVRIDPAQATAEVLFAQAARRIAVAEDGTVLLSSGAELLAWSPDSGPPPCSTTVTGEHRGPLVVADGVTCVRDATVTGPVTVAPGAALVVDGARLTGAVTSAEASSVHLTDARIRGAVVISGSDGEVVLADSTVSGSVNLSGNTGGVTVADSTVFGHVNLSGNTGGVTVTGTTIAGSLSCAGNDPPPDDDGRPNEVAGAAAGQCSGF